MIGILSGVLASLCSVLILALLFHFDHASYVTFLPKSITTAIGIGVSEELGGHVSVSVVVIIVTAVFAAQANHPELSIKTIAIAARNANGFLKDPISPCGACRQVILEIEDRYKQPVRILLYGTEGIYCFRSIKDLLPFSFVDANMR